MSKYVEGIEFVTETCCNCGMPFAMTADFQRRKLDEKGSTFYCPAGHAQHYTGESETAKLKRKLEARTRELEAEQGRALALKDQRDSVVKAHRKMRDRVKNGVCPCCNRTFQNLLNHMKTEHPDFSGGQQLRALRDTFGLTQPALGDEAGVSAQYVSLFERDKAVPDWAKRQLEYWVTKNAA